MKYATHLIWLIGLLALLPASVGIADDKADQLAIVVNKETPLDNITTPLLGKIFKCEKPKVNESLRFSVVMRESGSPERAAALKYIYQMSEADYQKYFLQATFTGAVQAAPKKIASPQTLKRYVANTPGAISYMAHGDVDDTVKVVRIDGKLPGDADYGLKMK